MRAIALAATIYVVLGIYDIAFEALAVIAVLFVKTMDVIGRFQKSWQALAVVEAPYGRLQHRLHDLECQQSATWGNKVPVLLRASYSGMYLFTIQIIAFSKV